MPNRNQNQGNHGDDGRSSKGRGFAGMDAAQQRQIASAGGRAAHASGHAHEFSSEEAREAGRKGGEARIQRSRGGISDQDIQDHGAPGGGRRGCQAGRWARAAEGSGTGGAETPPATMEDRTCGIMTRTAR